MYTLLGIIILHGLWVNAKYYEGVDLKTLKQLAKAFPNHAIEIQIEGARPESPRRPRQRTKNPWLRENGHFQPNSPYKLVRSDDKPNPTTEASTTTVSTSTTTTIATTRIADSFSPQLTDHQKRPLYMEDLIQALEDFEKKLNNKMNIGEPKTMEYGNRPLVKKDLWDLEKSLNCNSNQECTSEEYPGPVNAYFKNTAVKDIKDVVKLIQKGVKVELEVTTPGDTNNNFNWIPIKIKKEI